MDPHNGLHIPIPVLDLLRAEPIARHGLGLLARLTRKLIVHGISPLPRAIPAPDPVRAGSAHHQRAEANAG
jgi:hypothetical protein